MNKLEKKRKKNKKVKLFLTIGIVVAILIIVPAYAYMRQELKIKGKATIDDSTLEQPCDALVDYKMSGWYSNNLYYYKIDFTLTNSGDREYNFWDVYFDIPADGQVVSNSSSVVEIIGNRVKVSDVGYNSYIAPGASISFEIQIATSNSDYVPTSIFVNDCFMDPNHNSNSGNTVTDNISIDFNLINTYGNYVYQYDVTVYNNSAEEIKNWYFSIENIGNLSIVDIWNANYVIRDNDIEFSNMPYNAIIGPGQNTTFGFIIHSNRNDYVPQIITN